LKDLAEELPNVVFPHSRFGYFHGKLQSSIMYDGMINASDKEIGD
jgi:hypothetical protein